jgi:hypothetical protein
MEQATFTLYDQYDSPRMKVILMQDAAREKNVMFGLALCSEQDKWDDVKGFIVCLKRITTYGVSHTEYFRTTRAHRLIQSLCEEDYHKLMTLYEYSNVPFMAGSGYLELSYEEALNLLNNGTTY